MEIHDLRYAHLVVATNLDRGAKLAQIVEEVVGEAVVVIDKEDHSAPKLLIIINIFPETPIPAFFGDTGSRRWMSADFFGSSRNSIQAIVQPSHIFVETESKGKAATAGRGRLPRISSPGRGRGIVAGR